MTCIINLANKHNFLSFNGFFNIKILLNFCNNDILLFRLVSFFFFRILSIFNIDTREKGEGFKDTNSDVYSKGSCLD